MKTCQCTGHNQPARRHAGLASKYDAGQSINTETEAWRLHTVSSIGVSVSKRWPENQSTLNFS
jgi:hypothetical protein